MAKKMPGILLQSRCDRAGVLEVAELRSTGEGRRREHHHGDGADHDDGDADPQIDALVADEARRDALVDDVALLKEELPGRHCRADDGDDQQHQVRELGACGELRHDQVVRDLRQRRVHPEGDRHQQKAAKDEQKREPFEPPEVAGPGGRYDDSRRGDHAELLGETEVAQRQGDADELGHDRERVQQKQVDDAEGPPELADALEDEPGMADAGHRTQPQHHLLVDVEDRYQQDQRPEERRAVGLGGLRVCPEGAGVIVSDHDDEARSQDCKQRPRTRAPGLARGDIAVPDGSQGTAYVADMGLVEDSIAARHGGGFGS
jgi:hypothetical protein